MTTEKERLEENFHNLIDKRNVLTKEINRIWKLSDNPKTYDAKLYDKQGELIKERLEIYDLIDENAQERRDKGYIEVIL